MTEQPQYTFRDARSNCGVGVLVDLDREPNHDIVEEGFTVLENLDHRGARGAEENTGDGAGMLIQVPRRFLEDEVPALTEHDTWAVGQVFLPQAAADRREIINQIEAVIREERFSCIAWREVPTENASLGKTALSSEPAVYQCFVAPTDDRFDERAFDQKLYVLRRVIERKIAESDLPGTDRVYICSLDRRRLVYKGLLTNAQLREYYPDLRDERVQSQLVLVHSRFSTNTLGAWELAHPYRAIVHNGEINTLQGNLNWMRAREAELASEAFDDDIDRLKPITHGNQSDTAVLDNVLELLVESGRSVPHALRMLIPEAWEKNDTLDPDRRDWYRYHATINEPWDGPLLAAVTDGTNVGAVLDRNGLRPCRYYVRTDGRLVMSSETGVLDDPPADIIRKERLRPGQLFYVDGEAGEIVPDEEIFDDLTDPKYRDWLDAGELELEHLVVEAEPVPAQLLGPDTSLRTAQRAYGYTLEHLRRYLKAMAEDGKDPVGAMGNDTPPAVLSNRNKQLFTYFYQLFAQVSNPPIDYIREDLVTSLDQHLGNQRNLLAESPEHCRQISLTSPILDPAEFAVLESIDEQGITAVTIDATFPTDRSLADAMAQLRTDAVKAIEDGAALLLLDDSNIGPDRLPIPSLLATGGIHHHLVRTGHRTDVSLIVASGQPAAVHDYCTLIGYGADAIFPGLAYESIEEMVTDGEVDLEPTAAREGYRHAVEHGIQKVMSKMGISTLESYKGAQIFEAVGLNSAFVTEYFEGTENRTEGVGIAEIEHDVRERHQYAFREHVAGELALETGGELYWRRDGEFHQWNPHTIGKLQYAAQSGQYEAYKEFASLINEQDEQLQTLRGMLRFRTEARESIPIEEVAPVEKICQRFFTGSMSFGSLSAEAHETLAIAMNRIGGTAGSGEGGEPAYRYGTERECQNKQVASGRFGVTSAYLANAELLEIKMAQGSKPGEGGHLPGEKVNEVIAETRNTTPGVPLISPPPHHDIYSIEDLKQLIHDLKCSNDEADVHVKLVSEDGVGIIAAGVAKAKADGVLISGAAGGTGASPKTSIKHAGLPWELGIAEAHRILLENRLRSRIRVRVDGGLKTGRDAMVAALLGAEEYGFGTAPLVTCGCIMLRKCHCNTCSVGIATQDPALREQFPGDPEYVVNYMHHMAHEIRELMAELGFRTMDELIGRVDLLETRSVDHPKAKSVDLAGILEYPQNPDDKPRKTQAQDHGLTEKLDHEVIKQAWPAIDRGEPVELDLEITNRNRTFGTMLSAEVAREHDDEGLTDGTITLNLRGTAGQSFGAFLTNGITMRLHGDVNDYCGKGLSGGKLVVMTPDEASYAAAENIITGNVALYGATAGEAYFNGRAGERFAVRNSGVLTVVEGIGDHGCEYMTGGVAVILGNTGRNFGAGMSGGEAYVYDAEGTFAEQVNPGMVTLVDDLADRDRAMVRRMIENHVAYTESERGAELLVNWEDVADRFVKVMPDAYADVIESRLAAGEDIRIEPPSPVEPASVTGQVVSDD